MATYKDLVGTAIRNNAGNIPTAESGQVFFDSTNVDFKYQFTNLLTSWRTTSSTNTATGQLGGNGTSTSALIYGGNVPADQVKTESWNGVSWTEVGDLTLARRRLSGAGASNTSALAIGGTRDASPSGNQAVVESWNGASWTEVGDLTPGKSNMAASGTQTAALSFGGNTGSVVATNELWNGASWTEVGDLNQARQYLGGSGTYTSTLASGGQPPTYAITESWNGTSWTEVADLNTARYAVGAGGVSNSSGIIYGGYTGTAYKANTETWNGSAWSETSDLATARGYVATNNGIKSSALCISGNTPPYTAATEEFVVDQPVGAWATGGSLNTARFGLGGFGIQTAGLMAGGQNPSGITGKVESYNGTAYSEVADITARRLPAAAGTSTAGLVFGGSTDSTTGSKLNESWNGSAFSEIADMTNARGGLGGDGTQTSAIAAGGRPGTQSHSETWNGSSWTETSNLNQARHVLAVTASANTAAVAFGGMQVADYESETGKTELWNGSSWTEVNDLNTARGFLEGGGTSTDAVAFAGRSQPSTYNYYGQTELWNGVSWQETTDMATARSNGGGTGTSTAAIMSGGNKPSPSPVATTEEWSGSSTTIKVLTD